MSYFLPTPASQYLRPFSDEIEQQEQLRNDPRIADWIFKPEKFRLSKDAPTLTVLGYPDDEGIQNNGGRVGAKEGPNQIRTQFYKMTVPPLWSAKGERLNLIDSGNFFLDQKTSIEKRHSLAREKAEKVLASGSRLLSFGGGHDYGYVDGAAFLTTRRLLYPPRGSKRDLGRRPLVINFDAHCDVRPTGVKGITSGTPFYRLLEEFKDQFDFLEIGLQPQCNSVHHIEYVIKNKGVMLDSNLQEVRPKTYFSSQKDTVQQPIAKRLRAWKKVFTKLKKEQKNRDVYLSIDVDVFTSALAPGCSQSFASGLAYEDFRIIYQDILHHFNVAALGIYEVSPPLDVAPMTSRLAALISYQYLTSILERGSQRNAK